MESREVVDIREGRKRKDLSMSANIVTEIYLFYKLVVLRDLTEGETFTVASNYVFLA